MFLNQHNFYFIINKMKLLINGKPRNIYFRKDKTVYYKNNRIENDITFYFKKSGELKKQYSNLLIEKNRKKITGGANFNAFGDITIEADINPENEWDNKTIKEIYEKLLQIFMLAKIQMDNNTMLFDPNINTTESTKIKLIKALQIIAGIYEPLDSIIDNIIPQTNNLSNTEIINNITNVKKQVFNDDLQLNLDHYFIELNRLETYNDNEISALFTQANKIKYDTNPIKLNMDIIDDATILRIKEDILDIVSYDRIVIKLEILKDTNDIDYYTHNLKNLKKLMLDAKLFDETDVLPIDSSIVSSIVPNVIVDKIDSLDNLNDKTNQLVNNSTINTMGPNVIIDKLSSLDSTVQTTKPSMLPLPPIPGALSLSSSSSSSKSIKTAEARKAKEEEIKAIEEAKRAKKEAERLAKRARKEKARKLLNELKKSEKAEEEEKVRQAMEKAKAEAERLEQENTEIKSKQARLRKLLEGLNPPK
jgi:hypothetical protein